MPRFNIYTHLGVPPPRLPDQANKLGDERSQHQSFDPDGKYVTSPFMSPFILASIRLLVAMYTLVTLVVTLAWKVQVEHDSDSFLSYFTYLTYIGLCSYYFAAGTQTLAYALQQGSHRAGPSQSVTYPLQRWWRPLQALHVALQATIVNMPIIVTAVFWALLSDSTTLATTYSAWNNLSVHALNTVFLLIEVFLTNSPPAPWLTLLSNLAVLVGYLCVAYITHATQGIYTYSFLDPTKQHGLVAAYVFGISLAECVVFTVVRYIIVLRQRWAVRRGRLHIAAATGTATLRNGDGNISKSMIDLSTREREDDWLEVEVPAKPQLGKV